MRPLLLIVCVAVASAGQNPPAATDARSEAAREFVRARNARDYAITTPNGIDEAKYVEVGGIEQWITIRGENRNNPVLLFFMADRAMRPAPGAMPGSGCGSSTSRSSNGINAAQGEHSAGTGTRRERPSPSRA